MLWVTGLELAVPDQEAVSSCDDTWAKRVRDNKFMPPGTCFFPPVEVLCS